MALTPEEVERLNSIPLPETIREFVALRREIREARDGLRSMNERDKDVYALLRERLSNEMGLVALVVDGTAFRVNADRRGIEMIPVSVPRED